MGAEGAYGSGSHFTGFPGVYAARTKSVDEIVAALSGGANPDHDFSAVMDDAALTNLAAFIQGVMDYTQYIDYSTKTPIGGDAANGQVLFEEGCAVCHGADGTQINFHDPDEPEYVGTIAVDNPQEFMHKAIYGQPGSNPKMVGSIETGWTTDQVVDVLAYAQTLPTGGEEPAQLPETGGVPLALPLVLGGALSLGAGLLGRRKG
jgi:thiosulfate dehydrogenase